MEIGGMFTFPQYNLSTFTAAIVNAFVLSSVPRYLTMGVAFFGIGVLSKIYYSSAYQVLKVGDEFPGTLARIISSRMAVAQLKDVSGNPTDTLNLSDVNEVLTDSYAQDLNAGYLTAHDVHQMARFMMTNMDDSRDGEISVNELLHASTSNEVVDPRQIRTFFHRKKSVVTGFFDDTPLERSVRGYDPEFNVSQGRKKRLTQLGELRSARGLAGEE